MWPSAKVGPGGKRCRTKPEVAKYLGIGPQPLVFTEDPTTGEVKAQDGTRAGRCQRTSFYRVSGERDSEVVSSTSRLSV